MSPPEDSTCAARRERARRSSSRSIALAPKGEGLVDASAEPSADSGEAEGKDASELSPLLLPVNESESEAELPPQPRREE